MPRAQWITGKEAAELLTKQSGHTISQAYVRWLAHGSTKNQGKYTKVRFQKADGRTTLYNKSDLEKIVVKEKKGPVNENGN